VDHLGLEDLIIMGQDWGGPIAVSVATAAPERVSGLVLGNTWCWPLDRLATQIFSRVMSSPPVQWAILQRNFFVERLIPAGTARPLTTEEMDHNRGVQPTPQARVGVAEFPRQLLAAKPWLADLAARAPGILGAKPVLLVWGIRDIAFPPKATLPRMRATFHDLVLVELLKARHFIEEDTPEEISRAITERFG
jgi:haloalkane dehalogenase